MSGFRSVTSTSVVLRETNIDTDQIIPARFLSTTERAGLGKHAFNDWRWQADGSPNPGFAFNQPHNAGRSILLAGRNFGCGSSREHAPQAIQRWGIKAIVGESFAGIFSGNALMLGLPCVTADHSHVRQLMDHVERHPDTLVRVDVAAGTCDAGPIHVPVSIPPKVRQALLTGAWDTTSRLLADYHEVDATAAKLPYVNGFV
jgi:3-isopropylmalate/(R)-2-methylmalate dehydratase small subunit